MKWITRKPMEKDKLRIFCFPYAGGGASIFRDWDDYFAEEIGVYPIQLPGRENRLKDEVVDNISIFLDEVSYELTDYSDKPCIFFGHSLGGRLAYALASYLEDKMFIKALIISASPAPNSKINGLSDLDDKKFLEELAKLNGTPKEIINNLEIFKIFIPMLRADYKLDECTDFMSFEKVRSPIFAIKGINDTEVGEDEIIEWRHFCEGGFNLSEVNGSHFYVKENEKELLTCVGEILRSINEIESAGESQ